MKKLLSLALSTLFVSSAFACPPKGLRVEGTNCTIFATSVECNGKVLYNVSTLETKETFVAIKRGERGAAVTLTVKTIKNAPVAQGITPLAVVYTYDNQITYTMFSLPNNKVVRMDSNTDETGATSRGGLFAPEAEVDPVTKITFDFKDGGCR